MRKELQNGYKLKLPGRACEYEIVNLLGRGASCFVYLARYAENEILHEVILKEYNPKSLDLVRADSGVLCIPDDKRHLFEAGLARFRQGYKKQAGMRLNSDLTNATSNIQGIHTANQTQYIEMTFFAGVTYCIDDHPTDATLYDFLRRMKSLATVISYYHKAGYLHLDIKPDNVFAPKTTDGKEVILFDFDSMVEKSTISNAATPLSYTKEWAAMEQINPTMRASICEATDIFSVGEMIFYRIFGRHSNLNERRSYSDYSEMLKKVISCEDEFFCNVNPKVYSGLNMLLKKSLCNVVKIRHQSAEELIVKLDELIKLADPKEPYLVSTTVTPGAFFIGREKELCQMHEMLQADNKLFLSGIGGIGKSELAKNYAVRYRDSYDTILFATYNGSWTFLVGDDSHVNIANFERFEGEKEQDYCARKLRKLAELCDERTLFLIDNLNEDEFSGEEQSVWTKILGLNCKFIFTTRLRSWSYPILDVGIMAQRHDLVALFQNFCAIKDGQQADVDAIIDYVDGHTLTVELIARQIKVSFSTPAKMLNKLQKHGIAQSGKEKVTANKDNVTSRKTAFDHVCAVFDIAQLSEPQLYVMANMSLIPPDGIEAELFGEWCELEDFDAVNELVNNGWIDRDEDKIRMHPVVSKVVVNQVKNPTEWDTFLWHLYYTLIELDEFESTFEHEKVICENIICWAIRLDIRSPLLAMIGAMSVPTFFWFDDDDWFGETLSPNNEPGNIEELFTNIADTLQYFGESNN